MDLLERRGRPGELQEGGGLFVVAPEPANEPPPPVDVPVAPKASGGIRTYEELDGAEGRAVFFRPHRYTAADMAPLRATVTVDLAGALRECALRDVSQNGVAFTWPAVVALKQRQRLHVVVRFDAHEAFRGEVRVGSVRERDGSTLVGVSFNDFLLDIDELLQMRAVRAWAAGSDGARVQDKPWGVAGGERFKARVAELRLLLQDGRQHLDALEKQLPWHVLQGKGSPVLASLAASLRAGFVAEVVRLSEEIDAAVRELPGGHQNALAKEWSLRHLDEFLMQSPGLHRARQKPFGYPGDYEVMNFIYERYFEGATLFARAIGLAFSEAASSRAVRYRKDLVTRQLRALLSRRAGSGTPVRVLSIAAGPAQELFELFQEFDELPSPLEVVLFEQDKNALAHAWRRLKPFVEGRFSRSLRLTFLHDSIKRLLRDAELFTQFGKFDLVYSCGLFDYLQHRTWVVLARHLAAAVAPGGQLLVANMVDHPARWLLEHHLDWQLIYRTREELLDLGRRADPGAQLRILEEESRANPFLELVRG